MTTENEDSITDEWECPSCYAMTADEFGECWQCGAERPPE